MFGILLSPEMQNCIKCAPCTGLDGEEDGIRISAGSPSSCIDKGKSTSVAHVALLL